MTTVQQQAIPSILGGADTLVKSQTGSGKTLTYALPILHSLMTVCTIFFSFSFFYIYIYKPLTPVGFMEANKDLPLACYLA